MENKKYYWIKLRKDFFERDDIDFLLSQEKGCEYIVLYQMLCMKTSNNNGLLGTRINEVIIPYDAKKITRDCKYFDYDTIIVALELYKQLGLVYEEENNVLKITDYENLVGSESKWAEKKRIYREKQKMLGHKEDIVLEEIEKDIEIDKEIDIKEKEINKEKENIFDYYQQEIGELSPRQYEDINEWIDKYGEDKIKNAIDIACNNNAKTFNYVKCVLTNKSYKPKKENKSPEWLDRYLNLEGEKLSQEELDELEQEMKIFG